MSKTTVILVGGFLGSGKTTLLREAAVRLAERGRKVGLVTNDQAPDLVDTALLACSEAGVREVSGSCFCCNFSGLQASLASLVSEGADCIVAEPVGSCTDLSATILQPLKHRCPEYRVAPLTVLVDPERLREVFLDPSMSLHDDAAYILRLQLAEADRIALSKADALAESDREELTAVLNDHFPDTPVALLSSVSGEGVSDWLDEMLSNAEAGTRIVEVDYDRYANGEAVLGWLNGVIAVEGAEDWQELVQRFMTSLQVKLRDHHAEIGHVKLILTAGQGRLIANMTRLRGAVGTRTEGELNSSTGQLTLNARAQLTPEALEELVVAAVAEIGGAGAAASLASLHCLKPGRPRPTHRYDHVVAAD